MRGVSLGSTDRAIRNWVRVSTVLCSQDTHQTETLAQDAGREIEMGEELKREASGR